MLIKDTKNYLRFVQTVTRLRGNRVDIDDLTDLVGDMGSLVSTLANEIELLQKKAGLV